MHTHKTEVVVIGAGLAGIATALELLDLNVPLILLDGAPGANLEARPMKPSAVCC